MSYKNYAELSKDNPEAVSSCKRGYEYLIRPDAGWGEYSEVGFIGENSRGSTVAWFSEEYSKAKKTGFIPDGGYG